MAKKSAAQIRRLQKRAESRGQEYVQEGEPKTAIAAENDIAKRASTEKLKNTLLESESDDCAKRNAEAIVTKEAKRPASDLLKKLDPINNNLVTQDNSSHGGEDISSQDCAKKLEAATKLQDTLKVLKSNQIINSKERRFSKRKAEAIAATEAGCSVEDLLTWFEAFQKDVGAKTGRKRSIDEKDDENSLDKTKRRKTPHVLFVGQLSFDTTMEGLFLHVQKELGKKVVTPETLRVRLLTDPKKQNKSRGMAFLETTNPELMYECLKLHHTSLDGRRINIERSAGGRKHSETRNEKITQYRKEQEEHMAETVNKIIADYRRQGHLDEGELDAGVVELCKRRSAAIVEAAMAQYVEDRGKIVNNHSAYLTRIICRITDEGVPSLDQDEKRSKPKRGRGKGIMGEKRNTHGENDDISSGKDMKTNTKSQSDGSKIWNVTSTSNCIAQNLLSQTSELAKVGVDMSLSEDRGDITTHSEMMKIFPSMGRGRGRGGRSGYM